MLLGEPQYGTTTWAKGDAGNSFLDTLKAMMAGPSAAERDKYDADFSRTVDAAEAQARLVDTINAQHNALDQAAETRIAIAREQTGVVLENPFRGGYSREAQYRVKSQAMQRLGDGGGVGPGMLDVKRAIFEEKMAELRKTNPALEFYQSLDDQARAISRAANDESNNAARDSTLNGVDTFGAGLIGGLAGSRRDPVFIASLFFGPATATGRTVTARIASSSVRQGLFNAGLSAVEQPAVQQWRADIGATHGVVPALENVGFAFLFGAIPGAVIQGVHELPRPAKDALARVARGVPEPGDAEAAAKALGVPLSAEDAATIHAGERSNAADDALFADRPAGAPQALHDDAATQAVRHVGAADEPPAPLVPKIDKATSDAAARDVMNKAPGPLAGVADLRADPELVNGALGSRNPDLLYAGRLATLSDEAFAMVRSGEARGHEGVAVAEMVPRVEDHADVLAQVAKARPETLKEARLLAADAAEGNALQLSATRQQLTLHPTEQREGPAVRHEIVNGAGERVGVADIVPQDDGVLRIDWIGHEDGGAALDLGTAQTRNLLRQLREIYPNATAVEGIRMSGARSPTGGPAPVNLPLPAERKAPSNDPLDLLPLARDDGSAHAVPADVAARAGERDAQNADLVRSCQS